MKKKKLLIDFDDVICEGVFLNKVNDFLGTKLKPEDVKVYCIDELIPEDKKEEFYNSILVDDFYKGSKILTGTKKVLLKLNEKYDVYICSSCIMRAKPSLSAPLFSSKYNYLIENLPFLDPRKFVFTSSKDIICGDIFIDDYLGNLENSCVKKKLLFSSYHNMDFTDDFLAKKETKRVNNWDEIAKILL